MKNKYFKTNILNIKKQKQEVLLKAMISDISKIDRSFFISASAGSGKTTILIDRICLLLLKGVDPKKILCITYTEAAAREVKDRIEAMLSQDEETIITSIEQRLGIKIHDIKVTRLQIKALCKEIKKPINSIKIYTFHGFCNYIVSTFAVECDLSPNYKLIDHFTKSQILDKIKLQVFANPQKYNVKQHFENICTSISITTIDSIINSILTTKTREFLALLSNSSPELLIQNIYSSLNINNKTSKSISELLNECERQVVALIDSKKLLQYKSDIKVNFNKKIDRFVNKPSYKNALDIFRSETKEFEPESIFFKAVNIDNQRQDFINYLLQTKKQVEQIDLTYKKQRLAKLSEAMLSFAYIFIAEYTNQKLQQDLIDYDDMIFYASKILNNPDIKDFVSYRLNAKIDHILVDEAQDTNEIQWSVILDGILGDFFAGGTGTNQEDKSLFIVGDEKQLIYGFQGSKHGILNQVYKKCESIGITKLEKSTCRRCAKSILNVVDEVFNHKDIAKYYSSTVSHNHHRNEVGFVEMCGYVSKTSAKQRTTELNWSFNANNQNEDVDEEIAPKELLAKQIKDKISLLLNTKKPQDIAILVKKRDDKQFLNKLKQELSTISVSLDDIEKKSLGTSNAVLDFISIAKVIMFELDDYSLACLLKCPICHINQDDVTQILLNKASKNSTLLSILNSNDVKTLPLKNLIQNATKIYKNSNGVYEFFYEIFTQYKIFYTQREQEELLFFINIAKGFESLNYKDSSMDAFLIYFDRIKDEKIDQSTSSPNSINISTIHSSKGLEFDTVILVDIQSGFERGSEDYMWFVKDSFFYVDKESEGCVNQIEFLKDQEKLSSENKKSENLNLLYVALTRAKNELYVFGLSSDSEESQFGKKDQWYNYLGNAVFNLSGGKLNLGTPPNYTQSTTDTFDKNTNLTLFDNFNNKSASQAPNQKHDSNTSKQEVQTITYSESNFNPIKLDYNRFILTTKSPSLSEEGYKSKTTENDGTTIAWSKQTNASLDYGTMAHKVLEKIKGDESYEQVFLIAKATIGKTPERLIKSIYNIINNSEFKNLHQNASCVINEAEFFSNPYLGRIDRLIIKQNEAIIIDFKTGLNPWSPANKNQNTIQNITSQLNIYKECVSKIYPVHVRSFAIFIDSCEIVEVENG